jgi:hypothetical protein
MCTKPLCDIPWEGCGAGDASILIKMKRFIYEERDLLTDGEMDFSIPPPHGFTCTINTTVENPALRDYNHSFSPPDRELINKEMEKMKQMNINLNPLLHHGATTSC